MTVKTKFRGLLVLASLGAFVCGSTSGPSDVPPTTSLAIAPGGPALANVTVVTFTASGSDPDGDPVSFAWDFGDGGFGTGTTATHVYQKDGKHGREQVGWRSTEARSSDGGSPWACYHPALAR